VSWWRRFMTVPMFRGMIGRVSAGHLWYLWRRMRDEKPHRFAGQTRINTFFPPAPSPAFDRFCQAVIARRRVPYSTYLAVTSSCPFRCSHCSYAGRRASQMTASEILTLIEQLKSIGACTLGFTGGEPLLRAELEDFVATAGPELATIVFTTGHGLSSHWARKLAAARVTCVTIGIESDDSREHDAVRGAAGSFAQAQQAVEACLDAGIYTAISTVGTRKRIASGCLERMYELAAGWGVGEFRVLAPVATGAAAGCQAFMLSQQEQNALKDFHAHHNRRGDGPAVASFAYLESAEMFGCGAGYHHLFIDAAGEVCPCDLTPLSFGNVRQEELASIWQRMARWFSRPRCKCLMGELAGKIPAGSSLPLPRQESELLCSTIATTPLPEVYRRLLGERTADGNPV